MVKFLDKNGKVVEVKGDIYAEGNEKALEAYNEAFSQTCVFDELRDIQEVESGLAVDIDDMLRTGVVQDSPVTEPDNGIEDPSAIIGRVSDVFDAIEAQRVIKKYGKKANIQPAVEQPSVSPSSAEPKPAE